MQCDDLIWQLLRNSFCSFKIKTQTQTFCRNENNVSGICSRGTCPLANSQYATVKEKEGKIYLCMKTIERAHLPAKLWEEILLDKNYMTALKQIDEHLIYWPSYLKNKCKQRLTRIHQYLLRMRKLKKNPPLKLVHINKKVERRERTREMKAEKIAVIDNQIKKELLERLKLGTYGEKYNFRKESFAEALKEQEVMEEIEEEEELEELEEEEILPPSFVADNYDDEEEAGDMEDLASYMGEDDEEFDSGDLEEYTADTSGGDTEGYNNNNNERDETSPPEKKQRTHSFSSTTSTETSPSNFGKKPTTTTRSPKGPPRKRIHREIEYEKTTQRQHQTNF